MDFYNFCTVVNRRKRFTHTLQKSPPHLINVLTLPSENENITFHTFIMHSLNITRCIKLNDVPDGIIHQIGVWLVSWPHVWSYGLSFSNVLTATCATNLIVGLIKVDILMSERHRRATFILCGGLKMQEWKYRHEAV